MKNQSNYVRHFHGLILALTCLITADGLLGQASPVFAQTAAPSWSYTGSLNTAGGGWATLLSSGKVLVAGGDILGKSELYDPATGTWSYTGSLNTRWTGFTATRLQNGKVLVAGGATSSSSSWTLTNTAALYDPVSGTWSPTGNLIVARGGHTATLLQNGKVLVVSGSGESFDILDTAELYDPETGTWTLTGKLNVARSDQTATLLKSGKVLIAGGTNDSDFISGIASAELYDPATGTWSITGSLNSRRIFHTATLLSTGKVLVTGGYNWPPISLRSAELYDPATGTWSVTGDLIAARESHTATLLPNGNVLVAGGVDWNRGLPPAPCLPNCGPPLALNSAELFDSTTETWAATASLNTVRTGHTATLLANGKVLVAGGIDQRSALSSAELYDSGTSSAPNPVDDSSFFIRQQYLDFLGREPEAAGLQFYLNVLNGCAPTATECLKYTRGALSANFFRSPEFQRKGNYVMYLYMVSIGQRPVTAAELSGTTKVDRPHYSEFIADLASISTPNDDPALTEVKKDALAVAWLQRAEIQSKYGGLSNDQFVKTLESTAGVTLSNEDQLIANLNNGSSRASVLRAVAESPEVNDKFYKQSFVTMEYFGYLRRDPEDCHNSQNWTNADPNTCGYIFHNNRFLLAADPDFLENTIVRGFIESAEYRQRFGP